MSKSRDYVDKTQKSVALGMTGVEMDELFESAQEL